ncbi:MAG: 50S ribosomal protein L13 [Acidimicrobiia bacterium]|nr:50S ribosomal protein L13 [Acidimicrobiia bacterium]NNF68127.1 50S ribosomal protein L13 [Acidimicrobiia bacterium]NNK91941.1 50S ribosomal protein L13 [Acidimicrobiia bacterium]
MSLKRSKTFSQRPADVERAWLLVDATDIPIGRLATRVASILRGKHKPTFTPHVDGGDYVVVINAAAVGSTGKKETDKKYFRHSGYPGGLREESLGRLRETHPERIIESAVKGMLPKNRLGRKMISKLKVYPGAEHPHAAQGPQPIDFDIRKVER